MSAAVNQEGEEEKQHDVDRQSAQWRKRLDVSQPCICTCDEVTVVGCPRGHHHSRHPPLLIVGSKK